MPRRWLSAAWAVSLGLALSLGTAGCDILDVTPSNTGGSSDSDQPTPDPTTPASDADELFGLERIPTFEITLPQESIDSLEVAPKEYVHGSFRYRERELADVGVKLKGNLSLTTLDEKPSLKIKFNKYVKGARFLQLKKLTLHSMRQDPTMMREWLGYYLFRRLGVPASRTGYAQIKINGEDYGLYLNVETPDDKMLARIFDDPTGNLYEGEHGDDINRSVDRWEQDEGKDESRDDLRKLRKQAEDAPETLFFGSKASLATQEAVGYLVAEAYLGHFDGYMARHNFFIYREPTLERWFWLPWSLDQAWISRVDAFEGGGYMRQQCFAQPDCLREYVYRSMDLMETFEDEPMEDEYERVLDRILPLALADKRKRHSNEKMQSRQKRMREWINERSEDVTERVDCLDDDGNEPDRDADGFGSCFRDCDDENAEIHPDAAEACDGIDNNCSGFADDVPMCECPSKKIEGATFYFCTHEFDWKDADKFCRAQGHVLAFFDDQAQNDAVAAHAGSVLADRWAIGLNDRKKEGDFRWPDGSKPSFTSWAKGEPSNRLDWFDCVFVHSSGDWSERNCVQDGPFICR